MCFYHISKDYYCYYYNYFQIPYRITNYFSTLSIQQVLILKIRKLYDTVIEKLIYNILHVLQRHCQCSVLL